MTSVYTDADFLAIYKQKQSVLRVFWAITIFYAVYCISWLLYYISLPYNHSMQILPKMAVYVLSVIYIIVLFPLMGIKFSRIRRYYRALSNFSIGMKNVEKNYFYCFEEHNLQKDNIDVNYCIFETWNKKKHEWMDREAYFDCEKPLPAFGSGDYVQYIVQSNFIIQYRILERGVYKFVEEQDLEADAEETQEN